MNERFQLFQEQCNTLWEFYQKELAVSPDVKKNSDSFFGLISDVLKEDMKRERIKQLMDWRKTREQSSIPNKQTLQSQKSHQKI